MRILPGFLLVFAVGCGTSTPATSTSSGSSSTSSGTPPSVCNGHAELCGRTYDAVTFPGTHDAYATHAG